MNRAPKICALAAITASLVTVATSWGNWPLVAWALIAATWAALAYSWMRTAARWQQLANRWQAIAASFETSANRAVHVAWREHLQ